ncbi:MAG: hypothetical protein ABEK84_04670 [Salinibacter sp.]
MEYLALAVILYFILRTAGNLIRLLGGEENPSQRAERQSSSARRNGWEGPSPRKQTGTAQDEPTYWGKDIEDATWRDSEEESQGQPGAAR